tara:strand:+ start:306 stop:641 length:336 start_codon:yes stop_codon:yes gene_type:complete
MSLFALTSSPLFDNSKLFFSKKELSKILSCYSLGVSNGNWKDYSINYNRNEASFIIYKYSKSFPDCILTKYIKHKKNKILFKLMLGVKSKKDSDKIEDLIAILKRKNIKLI